MLAADVLSGVLAFVFGSAAVAKLVRQKQQVQTAAQAIISGNISGVENHHCSERNAQRVASPIMLLLRRNCAKNQTSASSDPKTFAPQAKEKPRSKSNRKKPQNCGRNQVV